MELLVGVCPPITMAPVQKIRMTHAFCYPQLNVASLIEALKNIMREVKGLNPSGTVFRVHNEIPSWREGTRLNKQIPMFLGRSYFVIFHRSHKPKTVPSTVKIKNLGNTGMWEAWEIQMPTETGTDLVSWCANLGHVLLKE